MSYILDALKKAEVDRKLGEAVSLHDPAPAPAPNWTEPRTSNAKWLLGGSAALGLGALLAAWWLWPTATVPAATPPSVQQAQHTQQAQHDSGVAGSPATTHNAQALPHAPTGIRADNYSVQAVQLPIPARPAAPPPLASNKKASTAATEPASSEAAPQALTAQIRQQLPPLSVSGAMYADVPKNRMVVINGELFHEGDTIAPGLVLEHIALKAATLRYQGKAYLLAY